MALFVAVVEFLIATGVISGALIVGALLLSSKFYLAFLFAMRNFRKETLRTYIELRKAARLTETF